MALTGKIEAQVEFQCPADKLFSVFRSETHKIPNVASDKIHTVEVHEGDWETHGSVKLWKYTCEGKAEFLKEKVLVDDANKTVTFTGLEGHIMEEFKSYKAMLGFTPKSDGGGLVKITLEYEKLNENIPGPDRYLQILVNLTKDLEAHLLKPQ
ncbi:hypothetical protein PTKIN_Ptkin02bG0054500 [Pterospermum kingtungense]